MSVTVWRIKCRCLSPSLLIVCAAKTQNNLLAKRATNKTQQRPGIHTQIAALRCWQQQHKSLKDIFSPINKTREDLGSYTHHRHTLPIHSQAVLPPPPPPPPPPILSDSLLFVLFLLHLFASLLLLSVSPLAEFGTLGRRKKKKKNCKRSGALNFELDRLFLFTDSIRFIEFIVSSDGFETNSQDKTNSLAAISILTRTHTYDRLCLFVCIKCPRRRRRRFRRRFLSSSSTL